MNNSTTLDERRFAALPDIPRDTWPQHENFATQSGLLRAHDSFRQISDYLVEKSSGANSLSIGNLIFLFLRWKQAMRNHEAYEERKLYPYLADKYGVTFDDLEAQHERLGELERQVIGAWGEGDVEGTSSLLAEHDRILRDHLMEEEDRVIPMILSFTPEEYSRV